MDSSFSYDAKQAPAYLQNSDIRQMLHGFLDRLDNLPAAQRKNRISCRISPKHFPPLFVPEEPDDDEIFWQLLLRCQKDGLIRITSEYCFSALVCISIVEIDPMCCACFV